MVLVVVIIRVIVSLERERWCAIVCVIISCDRWWWLSLFGVGDDGWIESNQLL